MLTQLISKEARLVRDVVMLPLRIGVDVTRLGLRITRRLIEGPAPASPVEHAAPPAPEVSPEAEAPPPVEQAPPVHVSSEPELVESFAEPGAEDGAGADVHVREPWTGYRQMTADDVMSRLTEAGSEELAAVVLYEGCHRARRTVIAEAERRLRRAATTTQPN